MYLTRALFPKPTLLVTARGGAVFWSYLSQVTKAPALCIQLCRGDCTVPKEVAPSEKCPSEDGENFQSLNHKYFDLLCDFFSTTVTCLLSTPQES